MLEYYGNESGMSYRLSIIRLFTHKKVMNLTLIIDIYTLMCLYDELHFFICKNNIWENFMLRSLNEKYVQMYL